MTAKDLAIEFAIEQDLEFEEASTWCYPSEHDMIDAGDNESPFYTCTRCGYYANAYITKSFLSESLVI